MSGITQEDRGSPTGRDIELTDTDMPLADNRDHMGRPVARTAGEAFRQDWPWILALLALIAVDLAALAGYLR
ncbi:MAG: hypothetical protein K2X46_04335 [Roseomonas sp.]|nr:hypothetical protein [Roseomonas sp.]